MELGKFLNKIGYKFSDEKLLIEALTHPSFNKDSKSKINYQRLEFLGDKVLSLVISEYLMKNYKNENEGELSRRHAALVSGDLLAKVALEVGLNEVLRVSIGEKNIGGKNNKRNLENALEALIGAIYSDSDFDSAKKFIFKFWNNFLGKDLAPPKDPVSQLQEYVQLHSKQLPKYEIIKTSGSDHMPVFTAKVSVSHLKLEAQAIGNSKKDAQKEVAIAALKELGLL